MSGTMAAAHELVIIPEGMIADLLTRQAAFDAVEAVFAGMASGAAVNFPVVREALVTRMRCTASRAALIARAGFWA